MYENVYYSRKGDQKPGEAVNTYWGAQSDDLVPGFTTSQKNRPLMIAKLEEYIRNKTLYVTSKRFHEEAKTFIWNNGRPEAMRGHNDDITMAMSIGVWIRDTFLAPSMASVDITKKTLSAISLNTHTNVEIDGASKDPRFVRQANMGMIQRGQAMAIRLPNGDIADFSWLLPISKG
jgi:hypothetical protein